jgi:hypothetical protein
MQNPSMLRKSIGLTEFDDEEKLERVSVRTVLQAAKRIQRFYRRRKFIVAVQRAMFFNRMRRHVLKEIVDSEARFVEAMHELKMQFETPLSAFIPFDEMQALFPWVDEIMGIHDSVQFTYHTVAKDLLKLAASMESVYTPHILQLRRALDLLNELNKNDVRTAKVIAAAQIGNSRSDLF